MRYQQISPPDPSLAVVSAAEAAAQCFVTNESEFPYLAGLVAKAVEWIERSLSRQLLTATWCCYLDAFPNEIVLEALPGPDDHADPVHGHRGLSAESCRRSNISLTWPARTGRPACSRPTA